MTEEAFPEIKVFYKLCTIFLNTYSKVKCLKCRKIGNTGVSWKKSQLEYPSKYWNILEIIKCAFRVGISNTEVDPETATAIYCQFCSVECLYDFCKNNQNIITYVAAGGIYKI
jgi:hypothetical protein